MRREIYTDTWQWWIMLTKKCWQKNNDNGERGSVSQVLERVQNKLSVDSVRQQAGKPAHLTSQPIDSRLSRTKTLNRFRSGSNLCQAYCMSVSARYIVLKCTHFIRGDSTFSQEYREYAFSWPPPPKMCTLKNVDFLDRIKTSRNDCENVLFIFRGWRDWQYM